jgi:DNA polymerase epsilon subunit 4
MHTLFFIFSLLTSSTASAVSHHDHLEFLEDVVPKTVPYKKIKAAAGTTQARLRGENATEDAAAATNAGASNRPLTANGTATIVNGEGPPSAFFTLPTSRVAQTNHSNHNATGTPSSASAAPEEDPNQQLELEMRQAQGPDKDADVHMTG